MWPFDKYTSRRKEIRRDRLERLGAWRRELLGRVNTAWALTTIATAVLVCLILNAGNEPLGIRVGQHVSRGIPARVDFRIPDEPQTRERRVRARDASPLYYVLEVSLLDDLRGRLANALSIVRANKDDPQKLNDELTRIRLTLDEAALARLAEMDSEEHATEYLKYVDASMNIMRSRPLVEPEGVGVRRTANTAVLIDPASGSERSVTTAQLAYASDAEAVVRLVQDAARAFPEPLTRSMQDSIEANLHGPAAGDPVRPLYRYDSQRTTDAEKQAHSSVEMQYLKFAADDVLVNAGEITVDELVRLKAEHDAYQNQLASLGAYPGRLRVAGRSLLAVLVIVGIVAYTSRYQPHGGVDTRRRILSTLVLVAMFAIGRYAYVGLEAPPHAAVAAVALATALLAIVQRQGIVLAVCGGLAILTTLAVHQSVGFLIVLLAVIGMFVFGLRQVRNRGKIVSVGVIGGAIALLTSVCVALIDGQTLRYSMQLGFWAGGGTLLAAFVIEGVLPGIERVFRLSTGMTLLEWCDGSKPLMRMMAADAPGTYNHSLLVGALAEAAAESIGANGLLCRAGAYYHDIGKINKPEYFVENQPPGVSRHERLTPAMSLLIIVAHVKDGIEMAREYGLPASLRPFIAEHHGTTLVEYFYHAANKLRKPDDREVAEAEFRYPGPKPLSRETAIVMMADGVEGAVRAMSEPTPGRIEDVVREIVRKRMMDGQFDECELTFQDLAEIHKSLVKTLASVYHARIVYPDTETEEQEDQRPARSAS